MERKIEEIFTAEVEMPEVVQKKAEEAFCRIRAKGERKMPKNHKVVPFQKKKKMHKKAVAVACICLLAVGGTTVAAAAHHYWSRGMEGLLQATDEQQAKLTDQGLATSVEEEPNLKAMAVTQNGVTVTPTQLIVDKYIAYLTFSVTGYDLEDGKEPGFEDVRIDNTEFNASSGFYDGLIAGEDGFVVYADGSPYEEDADGNIIGRYKADDGSLTYQMQLQLNDPSNTIKGKELKVSFKNLGTLYKTEYTGVLTGEWDFTIPLTGKDVAKTYQTAQKIGDTGIVVDSVEISPISIHLTYDLSKKDSKADLGEANEDNAVPTFFGVKLKDGSLLYPLANGGNYGYTDDSQTAYESLFALDRVIEADQVEAILLQKNYPKTDADGGAHYEESDFFVIPLQ